MRERRERTVEKVVVRTIPYCQMLEKERGSKSLLLPGEHTGNAIVDAFVSACTFEDVPGKDRHTATKWLGVREERHTGYQIVDDQLQYLVEITAWGGRHMLGDARWGNEWIRAGHLSIRVSLPWLEPEKTYREIRLWLSGDGGPETDDWRNAERWWGSGGHKELEHVLMRIVKELKSPRDVIHL